MPMDNQGLAGELNLLLKDYLRPLGLILFGLNYRRQGSDLVLRVLVDKPAGGISMGECAALNRHIGTLLDEKGMIRERYILEVSSPGLDRPLKSKDDFLCSLNKKARFFLNSRVNGKLEWEGSINQVGEESVSISVKGYVIEVPFSEINKAKLVI